MGSMLFLETSRSCSNASSVMLAWPRSTEMAAPGTAALILRATAKVVQVVPAFAFPRAIRCDSHDRGCPRCSDNGPNNPGLPLSGVWLFFGVAQIEFPHGV